MQNHGKKRFGIAILLVACLGFGLSESVAAQSGSAYYNPKDDQYVLLGLKRARDAFEFAKRQMERNQQLLEKKLISENEFERARTAFADAEVNYQQALLAVLFEKQYVAIKRAVKKQGQDGKKYVRLTLANTSGGTSEFRKLVNIDEALYNSLQPEVINDVYVSLLNSDQAIISQPYESKIERLLFGKPKTLQFELLQDVDAVTVNLIYGSGTQSSRKIYLQKDASENKVIVQAEQFSQEVELGGTASYGMSLELFSGQSTPFKLAVVNLPREINHYFTDPIAGARLSQFKFNESANTRRATLEVFVPDRPTEGVIMDKPVPFYVLVIPANRLAAIGNLRDRIWQADEIEALKIGYVRLELVPRGIGKLLVRAPQLYHSMEAGESVSFHLDLVNDGSRRLDNVEITVEPPLQWTKTVTPALVPSLDIAAEHRVQVAVQSLESTAVGRYEVRVRTTSLSDNQPIAGEDKIFTIEIAPGSNIWGTLMILVLIIALVAGLVIYGQRLAKR